MTTDSSVALRHWMVDKAAGKAKKKALIPNLPRIVWTSPTHAEFDGKGLELPYSDYLPMMTKPQIENLNLIKANVAISTGLNIEWGMVHAEQFIQHCRFNGPRPTWRFWVEGTDQAGNIWGYYKYEGNTVGGGQSSVIMNRQKQKASAFAGYGKATKLGAGLKKWVLEHSKPIPPAAA